MEMHALLLDILIFRVVPVFRFTDFVSAPDFGESVFVLECGCADIICMWNYMCVCVCVWDSSRSSTSEV